MNVHITLVGGQPAPIYHGIVATNPDRIVYVYSRESLQTLNVLKKEIAIPFDDIPALSPTDPHEIIALAEQLAEKYANDAITLNISSGLKSWSHLFGRVFEQKENAAVIYMDQNNILWNYKTMTKAEGFVFNMHTLFRLYGNSIENNYRHFEDYTDADYKVLTQIEHIRNFNNQDFNKLTTVLSKKDQFTLEQSQSGSFDLLSEKHPSKSYVEWDKGNKTSDSFVRICLFNKKNQSMTVEFESPHATELAFSAGWFEYKAAHILSKWDKAKEICMNCHFPFLKNVDKNEVDIIINTGTKLLFVECKTQITHTTDIDKFRNVIKVYGGTGSKGLFITDSRMTDIARKKCEENGIISFSLQDNHLGLSDEQALSLLLDSELFNINAK